MGRYAIGNVYKAANNGWWLVGLVVGSWVLAALCFMALEHASLINALYWGMTTMSTVGYGDFSPLSFGGKVLTICFQAWSIFMLIPCAVSHVIDRFRRDEHKFTHEEQEWQENAIKEIATALNINLPDSPADTNY